MAHLTDLQQAPPQAQETVAPAKRWRDLALIGGLLSLVFAGLAGLAAATGWEATLTQIGQLSGGQILTLLALSLVNYLGRGLRWHLFVRALGLPTTVVQDIRHFLGGFAMTVTPGRVGELIRVRWLKLETGSPISRTAPLILVDRASDLAAMALILALTLAVSTNSVAGGLPVVLAALIVAYAVTHPRLLSRLVTLVYRILGLWPRLFCKLRDAARQLRHFSRGAVLSAGLSFGIVGWLAEGYAFWLLLGWLGAEIELWTAIGIFVFATLAGGLTGAPGGVGGAEAAMIALLGLQGIPLEISVPATAVIRLTTLWFAILIGILIFPQAEACARRMACR